MILYLTNANGKTAILREFQEWRCKYTEVASLLHLLFSSPEQGDSLREDADCEESEE